jgi:hypothetical protein
MMSLYTRGVGLSNRRHRSSKPSPGVNLSYAAQPLARAGRRTGRTLSCRQLGVTNYAPKLTPPVRQSFLINYKR